MSVDVTLHGGKRIRERMGLPKRAVERMAQRALTEGIPRERLAVDIRVYLEGVSLNRGGAGDMRVFRGFLFLFEGEKLVTCWLMPEPFCSLKPKVINEWAGERHGAAQGQQHGLQTRDRSSTGKGDLR